jgi:biopolymer transport protein ExbB/TolQ
MDIRQRLPMTYLLDGPGLAPLLGNALTFAFEKATVEGKITITLLVVVSLFSWTVIITKGRQIFRALKMGKRFFAAYRSTRDPLDLFRKKEDFDGAPAFDVYYTGCEELEYHLKNNPVTIKGETRVSNASFESVKVSMERAVSSQGMSLEKGMIILSTAVAGGPFIGLLGTVWGGHGDLLWGGDCKGG